MKTPPRALIDSPGGRSHGTGAILWEDGAVNRANPENFPDSLTENIRSTFLASSKALLSLLSFWGGVLQTPRDLAILMFSSLLLFMRKKRASLNK